MVPFFLSPFFFARESGERNGIEGGVASRLLPCSSRAKISRGCLESLCGNGRRRREKECPRRIEALRKQGQGMKEKTISSRRRSPPTRMLSRGRLRARGAPSRAISWIPTRSQRLQALLNGTLVEPECSSEEERTRGAGEERARGAERGGNGGRRACPGRKSSFVFEGGSFSAWLSRGQERHSEQRTVNHGAAWGEGESLLLSWKRRRGKIRRKGRWKSRNSEARREREAKTTKRKNSRSLIARSALFARLPLLHPPPPSS